MIIKRRDFIKGAAAFFLTAKGISLFETTRYVERTFDMMGTQARISVFHRDTEEALEAISAAFKELQRIDRLMSSFKRESEIYVLNNEGFFDMMNDETLYVIEKANYYSTLTDGAFDISIQTFIESGGTIDANYRGLLVKGRNVFLRPDMKITLGGIGIGYAVDRAIEVLEHHGIDHALVNIGGDIKSIGGKGGSIAWKIGIKDPVNRERFIGVIDVKDNAVATSGNYERTHILNPKTKVPPTSLRSVTVMTKDCIDADALSTALFVLGTEKSLTLVESLNVESILITDKDTVLRSAGTKMFMAPYKA